MYITNCNKEQIDEIVQKYFMHPSVYLKQSELNGVGVFAKYDIPIGTTFEVHRLTTNAIHPELHRYIWRTTSLCGGIGFYANGSCPYFVKHLGEKFGPYTAIDFNCVYDMKADVFRVIKPIQKDTEIILNYGDQYFFRCVNGKIDYSMVNI